MIPQSIGGSWQYQAEPCLEPNRRELSNDLSHRLYANLLNQEQNQKEQHELHGHQNDWWDSLMADAIEQIPLHEKTGYVNALAKCPVDVRNSEADPAVFMEYENSNVWAAAKRLVNYWEWRALLFEEARAYQSIVNISGDETKVLPKHCVVTSPTDVDFSGIERIRDDFSRMVSDQGIVLLPQTDSEGNYVTLIDTDRFHLGWQTEERDVFKILRILMHNYTVIINRISNIIRKSDRGSNLITKLNSSFAENTIASTQPRSHRSQMSVVILFVSRSIPNNFETRAANARDLLQHAIPVRLIRVHLLFVPEESSWPRNFVQNVAATVHSVSCTFFQHLAAIVPHVSVTKADIVEHLLEYGISPDMIPQSIGGSWQYPITTRTSPWSDGTTLIGQKQEEKIQHVVADQVEHIPMHESTFFHQPQIPLMNPMVVLDNDESSAKVGVYQDVGTTDRNIDQTILYPQELPQAQHQLHDPYQSWNDLLSEAIENIPKHEKIGYLGAIQLCPIQIRNSEANPIVFIEYEDGNILAAANRLVRYWEWRLLLFGKLLAYQSILDITRNNSGLDIDTNNSVSSIWNEFCKEVENQALTILPQLDSEGNYVIIYNGSSFPSSFDKEINFLKVLRMLLYNVTILVPIIGTRHHHSAGIGSYGGMNESPDMNTNYPRSGSFIILNVIQTSMQSSFNLSKDMCDILLDAVPVRLVRVHMLFLSEKESWHKSTLPNIAAEAVSGTSRLLREKVLVIPHVGSITEIEHQLIQYGLKAETIRPLLQYPRVNDRGQLEVPRTYQVQENDVLNAGKQKNQHQPSDEWRNTIVQSATPFQSQALSSLLLQPTMKTASTAILSATTSPTPTTTAAITQQQQDHVATTSLLTPHTLSQLIPNLGKSAVSRVSHQIALTEYWRQKIPNTAVTKSKSSKTAKTETTTTVGTSSIKTKTNQKRQKGN